MQRPTHTLDALVASRSYPLQVALFVLCVSACATSFAQTRSNPNATLSIVDGPAVRLAPGATADPLFHVRIVDAQGAPIPGLVVQFVPDGCGTFGGQLNTCAPDDLYGHFADQTAANHVITDANGVAAAPAFVGAAAAAVYLVAGCVFVNDYPENAIIGSSLCLDLEVDQIALDSAIPITSAFTGAWYDPNQSGHGLFLEVLTDNRLLAYWFTFDQYGQQAWFGGLGRMKTTLRSSMSTRAWEEAGSRTSIRRTSISLRGARSCSSSATAITGALISRRTRATKTLSDSGIWI